MFFFIGFLVLLAAGFEIYARGPYYSDGAAIATYLGTTKDTSAYRCYKNAYDLFFNDGVIIPLPIKKLSASQSRLVSNALNEYELKQGEVYLVAFTDGFYKCELLAEITSVNRDGTYTYNWWGFSMT